jgi:T5SS/PEP-CTERM-associated repeat protein/autotransporter-associated beta strand protein
MSLRSILLKSSLRSLAPLLGILVAASANAQTQQTNEVQFEAKSGTSISGFQWAFISTSLNSNYDVSSGQPWNGVSSNVSGSTLEITALAGRQKTDGPADWFSSALQGGAATAHNAGGPLPNQLNFAFTGYMTLGGFLNNSYAVVIGQGSDGAGANNWWIGGPGFQNAGIYSVSTNDSGFDFLTTVNDAVIEVIANYPGSSEIGNDLILGNTSTPVTQNFTSGTSSYDATVVGVSANSTSNVLGVSGPGTQLTNAGNLMVGLSGSNNTMEISNGATVVNSNGYIGFNASSANNTVSVTGSNSTWSNTGFYLSVGAGGSDNSLEISDGGTVSVQNLYLGYNKSSSNNTVTVTGPDSTLVASGDVAVGAYGSDNRLVISDGATVTSGVFGDYGSGVGGAFGSNNSVLITGNGSRWTATDANRQFLVGYSSSSANTLEVADGGILSTVAAAVGAEGSLNNSVLITGNGSLWTNNGTLVIGGNIDGMINPADQNNGGSGTVTIGSGGKVSSANVIIASGNHTVGTLNIGTLGGSDSNVTLETAALSFGAGNGTLNFNQSDTFALTNAISGNGTVNVQGGGTTVLTANSSFSGSTVVSNGTLLVNNTTGSAVGSSVLTVTNGGTLGGNGIVEDILLDGGIVAPGESAGELAAINLIWTSGGMVFNLGASAAGSDSLLLSGNLSGGPGPHNFTFLDNGWVSGTTYDLIRFGGNSTIAIDDFAVTNSGGFSGIFAYDSNTLQFTLTAVPEPTTLALLGLGALTLAFAARRRAQ